MTDGPETERRVDPRRLAVGAGWGVVATLAMSVPMMAATASGLSPMPKPIPAAMIGHAFGHLPQPAMIALAAIAHLGYGAVAGAVLAGVLRRVTVGRALGYAVGLWVVMGLVWLPYLGWGPFGTAITARIAAATLLLHLVYGLVLGLLLARTRAGVRAVAMS